MPELGQILMGNPTGEFQMREYQTALVSAVVEAIGRMHWNKHQRQFDAYAPYMWYRPYYWGEDEATAALPNLAIAGLEIRWYKHLGRGMTVNKQLSPDQWVEWFEQALTEVRAHESQGND